MKLKDRVAIVTGGAQGLGKAFAAGLSKEGARVVVADILDKRTEATALEIRESGGEAMAMKVDVSDEGNTIELALATAEKYGGIDILVNNAALSAMLPRKPFTDITLEEWNRVMAVNVGGPFLCSKAVFPYMKARGKGKIINISSTTFMRGFDFGLMHYVASKGAVVGLTRQLARELGKYGISVNCVMPGLTASEGVVGSMTSEQLDAASAVRCFKRWEVPEDLIGSVIFFASDDSDFVTGQILTVDGGGVFY